MVTQPIKPRARRHGRRLEIALWTAQILLVLIFGVGGIVKLAMPIDELGRILRWPAEFPDAIVRFIVGCEVLGALGVVLPMIGPRKRLGLVAAAATGLGIVMILAAAFHASRGEWVNVLINLVFGTPAAFVAWGRSRRTTGQEDPAQRTVAGHRVGSGQDLAHQP